MRYLLFVSALLSALSCGGEAPTRPTPTVPAAPQLQTITLSGTVSETVPTSSTRIAGATVTIVSGPASGRAAMTDGNGEFQLAAVAGEFAIRVEALDYVAHERSFNVTGSQAITFELDPVLQLVTTTVRGSIAGGDECPGAWDYIRSATDACTVQYDFAVHHEGVFTADLKWTDRRTSLWMELFESGFASGAEGSRLRVELDAHRKYVLQIRKFSNGGGPPPDGLASFTLRVTRPN